MHIKYLQAKMLFFGVWVFKKIKLMIKTSPLIKLLFLFVLISWFFSFAVAATTNYGEIGLPITEVHEPFNEHGSGQNWHMVQDGEGLIYIGASNGLSVWDGETWTQYPAPNESRVRCATIWKDAKIYVGITDDIGYYSPDKKGQLVYTSLLKDWTEEEKHFNSVWSCASNSKGVVFSSKKFMLFWDGKDVRIIKQAKAGKQGLFSLNDNIYYKNKGDSNIYKLNLGAKKSVTRLGLKLPENAMIADMFINKHNNIVIVTARDGIYEVISDKLVTRLTHSNFPVDTKLVSALQAKDGFYYVLAKYEGLFIMDENFTLVKNYKEEHGLGTNVMFDLKLDLQGNIWMMGEPSVVKLISPHILSTYKTENNSKVTEDIKEIAGKIIVVGDSVHQLASQSTSLKPAYFKHIVPTRNKIWNFIRFHDFILYAGIGGVYATKINKDNTLIGYNKVLETPFGGSLSIDTTHDAVLVTSDDGLFILQYKHNQWITIQRTHDEYSLSSILANGDGTAWAGSGYGKLYHLLNLYAINEPIKLIKYNENDGLGKYKVIPYQTSYGLVFATGNGLMNFDEKRKPQFQLIKNMPDIFTDKTLGIQLLYESKDKLWYRADDHIGYSSKTDNSIHENLFNTIPNGGYRGFLQTSKDVVWVSMLNGMIFRLDAKELDKKPPQGHLLIRKITNLSNQNVLYGGFDQNKNLFIENQQNSIRIEFALTETTLSNKSLYRYRLKGNTKEWSSWSDENYKDFTSLSGDDYIFELEAKDGWGRTIATNYSFSVQPAWYASNLAFLLYTISLLSILGLTVWISQKIRHKKLEKRNLELQNLVKIKTSEIEKQQVLKDRFFANVSHEFRTPLTLTIAPLETTLAEHPDISQEISQPIKTAIRNAKKMLQLVGQILDINRLESGRFPLRIAKYNICELLILIEKRFYPWCQQNNQQLISINTEEPILLYYDQDEIDKCVSNLLSNAIKYSGNNSKITIEVIAKEDIIGISIKDNGKGISKEFVDKIFERYYQDENSEHLTQPGTGIGLALVKELIELHKGRVELINTEGKSCEFVLWLKRGKNHFNQSQLIEPIALDKDKFAKPELSTPTLTKEKNDQIENLTTVLVVDDNAELLDFISSKLAGYYKIIRASDGKQGLDMAINNLPDLIVSDVMMPHMTGHEMTEKLKNNELTQSIPIILLTAKSSKREVVKGLHTGADDYLTKPFDTPELIARISGLLTNRKKIRQAIQARLTENVTQLSTKCTFFEKLTHCINSQLSNPELSVDTVAELMGMSRQTLHRKCKKELGLSTKQIMTQTRMQHALTLIKRKKHSISEIAYGTGFESLAYFSRIFKKHYGQTPSEARKQA